MKEQRLAVEKKLKMYQGLESMLNRISPEICNVIDLGAFLQATVDELGRTMEVCRCEVLAKDGSDGLKVAYEYMEDKNLPSYLGRVFDADGLFDDMNADAWKRAFTADDVSSDDLPQVFQHILRGRGILSAMIIPISFQDEYLALVGLYHCRRPYRWSAEEKSFLASIAQQVAIAFQYTRMYTEKEREVEVTRTLLEIANDVNSRTDSLELTSFIVRKAVQILGAEHGCLALMDDAGAALQLESFIAPDGEPLTEASRISLKLSELIPLRVALSQRQTLFLEAGGNDRETQRMMREVFKGSAVLAAPLITGGETFGALCLAWAKARPSVTPSQIALAEGLASQMALFLERGRLNAEVLRLRRELGGVRAQETIVGNSEAIKRCVQMALNVAEGMTTVLIQGESGAGKELIADLIHNNSPRHGKPYIKINCGAIPETLIESELFGHEKGAFTGADSRRIGRFEEADGGTLFLDEVGELSPSSQVKLLRVLQNGEFTRVGGNRNIRVDVRVIAATNIDLEEALRARRMREDLYYRLNVYPIAVPPLRERREDIPLLAVYFLELYRNRNNKYVTAISESALAAMRAYSWPGNVRELENAVERAVVLAAGRLITLKELPEKLREGSAEDTSHSMTLPLGTTMAEVERRLIVETLNQTGGDKSRAARILGIGRKTLYRKLEKYS